MYEAARQQEGGDSKPWRGKRGGGGARGQSKVCEALVTVAANGLYIAWCASSVLQTAAETAEPPVQTQCTPVCHTTNSRLQGRD